MKAALVVSAALALRGFAATQVEPGTLPTERPAGASEVDDGEVAGVSWSGASAAWRQGGDVFLVFADASSSGTFAVAAGKKATVDVFAVGGGGAGSAGSGSQSGAGGGAGGFAVTNGIELMDGDYAVTVGAGGTSGGAGGDSSFACGSRRLFGAPGGRGGSLASATGADGGMSGDGLAGGRGINAQCTGGGAGAGAPGVSGSTGGSFWHAGAGGDGRLSTFTGRAVWYAGGGAGGSLCYTPQDPTKNVAGGRGGGGASSAGKAGCTSEAGTDGLGAGGAGGAGAGDWSYSFSAPGRGGCGVVAIRIRAVGEGCDHAETEPYGEDRAATCTIPGSTVGLRCVKCGHILRASTITPAPGHVYERTPIRNANAPKRASDYDVLYTGDYCRVCHEETRFSKIWKLMRSSDANHALVTAHRGLTNATLRIPENSAVAIRYAVENGCEVCEIDLERTKDGEYIAVHHDENLNCIVYDVPSGTAKNYNWYGYLENCHLRVGRGIDEPSDVPISRFEDILDAARNQCFLDIDCNDWYAGDATYSPASVAAGWQKMWEKVVARDMQRQCKFQNVKNVTDGSGNVIWTIPAEMLTSAGGGWAQARGGASLLDATATDAVSAERNDGAVGEHPDRFGWERQLYSDGSKVIMTDNALGLIRYAESIGRRNPGWQPVTSSKTAVFLTPFAAKTLKYGEKVTGYGLKGNLTYTVEEDCGNGDPDRDEYYFILKLRYPSRYCWPTAKGSDTQKFWYRVKRTVDKPEDCGNTNVNLSVVSKAAKAPTCTEAGWTEERTCSVTGCGKVLVASEPIPPLGHRFTVETERVRATVTEEGSVIRACERCGASEKTVLAKLEPQRTAEDWAAKTLNLAPTVEKKTLRNAGQRSEVIYRHGQDPAWGGTYTGEDRFRLFWPKDGEGEGRPLVVFLHGRGGDYMTQTLSSDMAYNAPDNAYAVFMDCARGWVATDGGPNPGEDYWWGATATFRGPEVGDIPKMRAEPPAAKRILDCIEWIVREKRINRNRIYLAGHSMGGQGVLGIGLPHGEVFAAIEANIPATIWSAAARMNLVDDRGAARPLADRDGTAYADPPPVLDWSGSDDVWSRDHDVFIEAMNRFRYAYVGLWGAYGHCASYSGAQRKNDLVGRWNWRWIERNRAYPVFANASCNDPLPWPWKSVTYRKNFWSVWAGDVFPFGTDESNSSSFTPRDDAPMTGQRNFFFRWENVSDDASGVSMKLWLAGPEDVRSTMFELPAAATADVTLRRIQGFRLLPGQVCDWTFGAASGRASADDEGLVTLPLTLTSSHQTLTLRPGACERLVASAALAAGSDGGDGFAADVSVAALGAATEATVIVSYRTMGEPSWIDGVIALQDAETVRYAVDGFEPNRTYETRVTVDTGVEQKVFDLGAVKSRVVQYAPDGSLPTERPEDATAVASGGAAGLSWTDAAAAWRTADDAIVIVFTNTAAAGTLTVADGVAATVDCLVVGGGGAGGSAHIGPYAGAGGGAGGFVTAENLALASGVYTATVGAGGLTQPGQVGSDWPHGENGKASSFAGGGATLVSAAGGGAGGTGCGNAGNASGVDGGSGGGAAYIVDQGPGTPGKGVSGQGDSGGTSSNQNYGGGGGGAGAPGGAADVTSSVWVGGGGGDGRASEITGLHVWYAGGGAGGSSEWYADGGGSEKTADGGKGGGGESRLAPNVRVSEAGVDTLGGGGAGAGCSTPTNSVNYQAATPGRGGNGVVVIRVTKVTGGGIEIGPGGTSAAYESQAAAEADRSKAVFVPSTEVAEMFAEDSVALAAYKAKFGFTVVSTADGKWVIKAEILPGPRTKLVESAQAATRQIPLAEIAALGLGVPVATSVENCVPGFYYSLYEGTEVMNLKASQSDAHRNVLCGSGGTVVFPSVVKPSLEKGFFSVGVLETPTVEPGSECQAIGAPGVRSAEQ